MPTSSSATPSPRAHLTGAFAHRRLLAQKREALDTPSGNEFLWTIQLWGQGPSASPLPLELFTRVTRDVSDDPCVRVTVTKRDADDAMLQFSINEDGMLGLGAWAPCYLDVDRETRTVDILMLAASEARVNG